MISAFKPNSTDDCPGEKFVSPGHKDTQVQLVISLGFGIAAFLSFCALRPQWKSLYAARRRSAGPTVTLPALPDSFFGWIPALYHISEEDVLNSAGLDAFVFLAFFKMSLKLFAVMFFFAAVVLEPINRHFNSEPTPTAFFSSSYIANFFFPPNSSTHQPHEGAFSTREDSPDEDDSWNREKGHLWAYLIFVYFFTYLTFRFMKRETFRVIKIRQEYLGSQATITDRTFRLSGIPTEFRSEDKIKALIEKLEIGKVESVTVCRKWKQLDLLVAKRARVLRKLEEYWSVYINQEPISAPLPAHQLAVNDVESAAADAALDSRTDVADDDRGASVPHDHIGAAAGETSQLLADHSDSISAASRERKRPQIRIWYGPLHLKSRKTDAIDYYEEKLRQLDEMIRSARHKAYDATDLAFVTMDSVAACQMAVQAVLDPRPGELLARLAPAPSDVIWPNAYISQTERRARGWIITIFITVLSVLWLVPVASLASLLSLCTIQKWAPNLAKTLSENDITKALVQTGLPTAVVSLLNVAVPYLYEYLSYRQGMLSQGDVELSIISKNFFFTFFNIFLVFTVFGTATRFWTVWTVLRDSLKDTTKIAYALAHEVQRLNIFYLNFIMLQGLGLFPFRLLEFGSVSLYPIHRLAAKTPRDIADIATPPTFSYGFYLPTALLVFILCLVYSVLPRGFLVLFLGFIYFSLGYMTYKYQLLYAMDQPLHATGGAWRIICYRILLGLAVFHLTMSGYLGANKAFVQATLVIPLFVFTVWYMYYFRNQFEPLTHNIALLSVRRDGDASPLSDEYVHNGLGNLTFARRRRLRRTSTLDEDRERGLRFVNPSLIVPLEQPWIYKDPPPLVPSTDDGGESSDHEASRQEGGGSGNGSPGLDRSASSSFSLGDTHIWRDDSNGNSGAGNV